MNGCMGYSSTKEIREIRKCKSLSLRIFASLNVSLWNNTFTYELIYFFSVTAISTTRMWHTLFAVYSLSSQRWAVQRAWDIELRGILVSKSRYKPRILLSLWLTWWRHKFITSSNFCNYLKKYLNNHTKIAAANPRSGSCHTWRHLPVPCTKISPL